MTAPQKKTPAKKTAPSNKALNTKIAADARKNYYKALEMEFRRLVKDACKDKDFGKVEQEFYQYGQYLQSHPDALAEA